MRFCSAKLRTIRPIRRRGSEAGIALLIAIFVLLLISVVAIAVVVSSDTESHLTGNYRYSTTVYYAALAGVEEARARLRPNDPDSFQKINPPGSFLPAPGATLPIGTVGYVLNPSPTDNAGAMLTTYPDTEYDTEFGAGALAAATAAGTVPTTQSVWNKSPLNGLPFSGPLYKWVRINAISEKSLSLDVDADGQADSTTPLYYDGINRVFSNNNIGPQALELTALAVLPNGSQKLLQYISASTTIAPPGMQTISPLFLAALTISGSTSSSPTFQAPLNNAVYAVQGVNRDCSGNPTAGTVAAIGLFGDYSGGNYNADLNSIANGIPTSAGGPPPVNPQQNYTGNTPPHALPDVEYLSAFPANLQSPSQIDAFAQNIIQNAIASFVPAGSAGTQQSFLDSLNMSPTNPVTVVVNGNLDLTNWTGTGYGLLLVTGTLVYDPATTWNGAVLVIGQGQVTNIDHGQYRQINGALFVAKTRDASGNLLGGGIGGGSVSFDAQMQGSGIRYSSCWVQKAQPIGGYKILSFHEISQ